MRRSVINKKLRSTAGVRGESGYSFLEILTAGAILLVLILAIVNLSVAFTDLTFALERGVQVNGIMMSIGDQAQKQPITELLRACRDEISSGSSRCVNETRDAAVADLAAHASPAVSKNWVTPLGWDGEVVDLDQTRVCIELVECKQVLKNQLLDIRFKTWWLNNGRFRAQLFTFRRAM